MPRWKVLKFVRSNGRCPIDEWMDSKALTPIDQAHSDAKIETIERIEGDLPPETFKKYKTANVRELKISGDRKKLRPLGVLLPGKEILLLGGAIEKGGKIPDGDIKKAENLRKEWESGSGSKKNYFED